MSFLKNHYEKLILTFLLTLFVIMFGVHVLSVVFETSSISPADELLNQFISDRYNPLKLDAGELNPEFVMQSSIRDWKANPKIGDMELMVPRHLARCPFGKHLIPIDDFKPQKGKCSYCAKTLPALSSGNEIFQVRQVDSDNDGIPDEIELRHGLNPRNSKDAAEDLDKDGYTNLEEYKAQTDLRSSVSHPPYGTKLYVVNVEQKPLGFSLQKFSGAGKGKNKKEWSARFIYLQRDKKGRARTKGITVKYGMPVEFKFSSSNKKEWITYNFTDIIEKWDENGVNRSSVVVTSAKDKTPIVINLGKQAIDPHQLVTFVFDVAFEKNHNKSCIVGKNLSLGNEAVGIDRYKLISADAGKRTAQLQDLRSGQVIIAQEWQGENPQNGMENRGMEQAEDRPAPRSRPVRQNRRGGGLPSFD